MPVPLREGVNEPVPVAVTPVVGVGVPLPLAVPVTDCVSVAFKVPVGVDVDVPVRVFVALTVPFCCEGVAETVPCIEPDGVPVLVTEPDTVEFWATHAPASHSGSV